ncbi:MAG: hypothetical protein ACRC5M_04435 [Anaeroplasmataceae bacterium]
MILKILLGICVAIILFLLNRVSMLTMMNGMINPKSTFDVCVQTVGMKPVNDFLRENFLKYINCKLIQIFEKSNTPITVLLSELSSNDGMSKMTVGFCLIIETNMSKDLKSFFNKYYNVIGEKGKMNDNFTNYVTEWFIMNIRYMQAKMTMSKTDITNYSQEYEIKINSELFTQMEFELYKSHNIIDIKN